MHGTAISRLAAPVAALAIGLVALCCSTALALGAQLSGPHYVHPHSKPTFEGRGFPAHTAIDLYIQPSSARGNNMISTKPTWREWHADGDGKVEMTFRFPSHYFVCKRVGQCERHHWRPGMRADVVAYTATGKQHRHARQVVRVIHRH